MTAPVLERIEQQTEYVEEGCWVWTGTKTITGYGKISAGGERGLLVHRVAYEGLIGPVPDGLELDHLCRNRACWNPEHLEPVTHAENVRRGEGGAMWRDRTHCPQGHPYDEANTRRRRNGGRACRACDRENSRRYRERRSHGNQTMPTMSATVAGGHRPSRVSDGGGTRGAQERGEATSAEGDRG